MRDKNESQDEKKQEWGKLLLLVGYAATFGSAVPVGYCIGVINSPASYMRDWCNETLIQRYDAHISPGGLDILWSTIVSIFLVGGAVGSLGGAWAADRFGRKGCFMISGLLFVMGAILFVFCRLASSVEMLLLGRFLVGLASGLTTASLPMYLTELAPLALRGTLGVFCAVGVTGGVVVGQVFSLRDIFGTDDQWHLALSFYVFLIIICYLPSYYYPESPKWLYIVKEDRESARRELRRLRGVHQISQIEKEIEEMETEKNAKMQTSSFCAVLRDPTLTLPLIIVCAFHGGQQLSGINAIFYYSVSIFESAGLSTTDAEWANLGAGCLNLLTSFLGPMLMAKVNRRPLMQFSSFMCAIFLFTIAFVLYYIDYASWFALACIVCIFCYIFFFQFGLGPIPYFIGSELFEVTPRPVAMAMGSLSSWSCNFIIGMAFPSLQNAWGAFVFFPFSITCVLLFLLTRFYLPETRGRDPSEVAPLVAKGFRSKKPQKWGGLLILVAYATTIGASVPVGYCLGCVNSPAVFIKEWCNTTVIDRYDWHLSEGGLDMLWASVVSILLVGGMIGSLCGAWVSDTFGRKGAILISGALLIIAAFMFNFCRAANSIEMLLIGRFIVGFSSGITYTALPMYLLEIAPQHLRGTLGVFCAVGVTGGIVVGQIFSLNMVFGNEAQWHYALSAYGAMVIICYLPSYYFPESPKWLYLIKGDAKGARSNLNRLRQNDEAVVNAEMLELETEANVQVLKSSFWSVISDPAMMLPLFVICTYQAGQQLSGVNSIFFYSVPIFMSAGFSASDAEWVNFGAGCLNLAVSLFGPVLMAKFNRRPLMLLSSSMCAIFLVAITITLYFIDSANWIPMVCIFCIFAFIFFFQFGLGPMPYFIGAELVEVSPRPVAMSMGSLASWICNFAVGMSFPPLNSLIGAFVFLPFAVACTFVFFVTMFFVPETRGRDSSELAPMMANGFKSKIK